MKKKGSNIGVILKRLLICISTGIYVCFFNILSYKFNELFRLQNKKTI
jgi:hypothetical protein